MVRHFVSLPSAENFKDVPKQVVYMYVTMYYISLLAGADLANLVNQAALRAASDGHVTVRNEHLDYARDKIIMGKDTNAMSHWKQF